MAVPHVLTVFPPLNALLNATAAGLLLAGFLAIRRGRARQHMRLMISAVAVSAVFLASYAAYHLLRQHLTGTPHAVFVGPPAVRRLYLAMLASHLVLAVAVLPLVLVTLARALRRHFGRHARIARWTLPLWLYVSVTGVLVYIMLYQLYRARG